MTAKSSQNLFRADDIRRGGRIRRRNYIRLLLNQAMELFEAESAGIVFGTNMTRKKFLPPQDWDRGILGHIAGRGLYGLVLRWFGPRLARLKKLSPIMLYLRDEEGHRRPAPGIIAYTLRNYDAFYREGVSVLIVPDISDRGREAASEFVHLDVYSYNGKDFSVPEERLMTTVSIIRAFTAKNFLGVLIPDFGILVINTAKGDLTRVRDGRFVNEKILRQRLDALIRSIEQGSLGLLFSLSGKQGAELLWRKEIVLRRTARELKAKEIALIRKEKELDRQRSYLRAVGGVTEEQLNMEPREVDGGVYCFLDMVGSATIRQYYNAEEYFFLTNTARQIMALAARHFGCRLDNYIGDAIFIESVAPLDPERFDPPLGTAERCAIVVLMLLDIFVELRLLARGDHPIDPEARVRGLLAREGRRLSYRAGVDVGRATVGPIGTPERRIVTGIGQAVDNASRLEATGRPGGIHLGASVRQRLDALTISPRTAILYRIINARETRPGDLFAPARTRLLNGESLSFEALHAAVFPPDEPQGPVCWLGESIFMPQRGVSYKEYRPERTYLLWPAPLPRRGGPGARPGTDAAYAPSSPAQLR